MKTLLRISIIALIAAFVTGCCACRSYQNRTQRPLIGTQWQLVQLNGKTVTPQADRFAITLLASDNRLTGVGACNRLMGTFEQGEKRALKIGPLAATRMACPDMALELTFTTALESTTHYDMDGPMLILLSNGEIRAVFQATLESK